MLSLLYRITFSGVFAFIVRITLFLSSLTSMEISSSFKEITCYIQQTTHLRRIILGESRSVKVPKDSLVIRGNRVHRVRTSIKYFNQLAAEMRGGRSYSRFSLRFTQLLLGPNLSIGTIGTRLGARTT